LAIILAGAIPNSKTPKYTEIDVQTDDEYKILYIKELCRNAFSDIFSLDKIIMPNAKSQKVILGDTNNAFSVKTRGGEVTAIPKQFQFIDPTISCEYEPTKK